MRSTAKVLDLLWKPKGPSNFVHFVFLETYTIATGIILSGGPYSVYEKDAPTIDPAVFELDVPILGICYGLQAIAWHYARNVVAGEKREYGHAKISIEQHKGAAVHIDRLFRGLGNELEVWMSHGKPASSLSQLTSLIKVADKLSHLPESFVTIATTSNAPFAGVAHKTKPIYAIQFHPEVVNTARGSELFSNFAVDICEAKQHWTMDEFVGKEISRIREMVGTNGQVIGKSQRHIQRDPPPCLQ